MQNHLGLQGLTAKELQIAFRAFHTNYCGFKYDVHFTFFLTFFNLEYEEWITNANMKDRGEMYHDHLFLVFTI